MLDVTTAYGLTYLFPAGDSVVGPSLRTYGEFARPEADLISHYLGHNGDKATFIDVGANIGAICLPIAARNPGSTVIALEAQRRIHAILSANALNNRLLNVECHHMAAGSRDGLADFPSISLDVARNFGDVGTGVANAQSILESVQMRKLDSLPSDRVGVIKIDVQGAELDVLQGATILIARDRPVLFIEITRTAREATARVADFVKGLGYSLFFFYSTFATPRSEKKSAVEPTLRGDYSLVALPSVDMNHLGLPPFEAADAEWPREIRYFQYLKTYGFR